MDNKIILSEKEYKRIFNKININRETNCWNWTGAKDGYGYGLVHFKGRTERIHRVIFSVFFGTVPKRVPTKKTKQLDHLCKNKSCCNPKHLELVTPRTNVLRAESPATKNHRKTHCKNGHPLSNQFRKNSTSRIYCKQCDSDRHKQRMQGEKREYWLKKANEASKRFYIKNIKIK